MLNGSNHDNNGMARLKFGVPDVRLRKKTASFRIDFCGAQDHVNSPLNRAFRYDNESKLISDCNF